ncbi:hypothetical protein EA472_11255 [Natrarchaeobius oligotrophus]|uniref:Uncharacterized protein n=1 Tax=Natrarchaeobius chitinivorans TaxID=1679083 RepID=A0A3N6NM11_NATCH|nr:hypothetical protein EA472_11255 [Natrarchaeobius chitinivorans]
MHAFRRRRELGRFVFVRGDPRSNPQDFPSATACVETTRNGDRRSDDRRLVETTVCTAVAEGDLVGRRV